MRVRELQLPAVRARVLRAGGEPSYRGGGLPVPAVQMRHVGQRGGPGAWLWVPGVTATVPGAAGPVGHDGLEASDGAVGEGLERMRGELLAFLERRLGSRADAEDVFQDAVVSALGRAPPSHDEAFRPWLYTTIKRALIDRWRRGEVARRAHARLEGEPEALDAVDAELDHAVCACVSGALGALKPEYGEALRAVELDEQPVGAWAAAVGITANHASVRLHRARAALRGALERACGACASASACRDCHCESPAG